MIKNVDLYDKFKSMPRNKINNKKYLTDFILDCGIKMNTRTMEISDEIKKKFGGLCSKQYPNELAGLLVFMYNHQDKINSYMELGCERGGTFFIIDSYMRSIKKSFKSVAIDKTAMIKNFDEYHKKFPEANFFELNLRDPRASVVLCNNKCDFTFIDGCHKYNQVLADFDLVKHATTSKFIGLHDIKLKHISRVQVHKLWKEIRKNYAHTEISNNDKRFKGSIGIGIIFRL